MFMNHVMGIVRSSNALSVNYRVKFVFLVTGCLNKEAAFFWNKISLR